MSVGEIFSLMRDGIFQVFILIAPALISALIVGLIVAIFQAVTSIQEQTLTFLPKLLIISSHLISLLVRLSNAARDILVSSDQVPAG